MSQFFKPVFFSLYFLVTILSVLFFLHPLTSYGALFKEPEVVYLTWVEDPSTTMTIQWHRREKPGKGQEGHRSLPESLLESFSEALFFKKGEEPLWQEERSSPQRIFNYAVYRVTLRGLCPDTEYTFCFQKQGEAYSFRTLPLSLEKRPLQFAVGGDVYFYSHLYKKMSRKIAQTDPDFVILGGDIAYTKGNPSPFKGKDWESRRWHAFLKEWTEEMRDSKGRLIPLLVLVGNHDVRGKSPEEAVFYELFAFPQKGCAYRVVDCGEYLSIFLLDSGHTHPVKGTQREWLEDKLRSRQDGRYQIAVYHRAAYPSVYAYEEKRAAEIRAEWVPLFEKYGVQVGFEHHNHAYKRSHPIKGGKIDPQGVVYLGDGSWGVEPRAPKPKWYLARAGALNCFWQVVLTKDQATCKAVDSTGRVIDEWAFTEEKRP